MSIFNQTFKFLTPKARPRPNPAKPRPKINVAISEAQGIRERQMQQHLLQDPQQAEN